jgi:acetyltransferase-like isoleucine patch superfamily enzyme
MRLASLYAPPHRARNVLARLSPVGYVAPSVTEYHPNLRVGRNIFVGDRVVLFSRDGSGHIHLGDRVHVYQDTFLETGEDGQLEIGADSNIHARCDLMAYKGSIRIGTGVSIAQGCAFYPYDHGTAMGQPIAAQPLTSYGDIEIGDGAWLGTGVIVLSGVRIGAGAVVAAGSLVMRSIPDHAIAAGVPARVISMRGQPEPAPHAVAI